MKSSNPINPKKIGISIVLFVLLCIIARNQGLTVLPTDKIGAWYSVIPPLVAVFLAFITHRIVVSLFSAILVGGLLTTLTQSVSLSSFGSGLLAGGTFVFNSASDKTNIQILVFVSFVMAMIAVLIASGGLQGMVEWLTKFVKGRKSAQAMAALSGVAMFIDDYANTMLIGSSMRPVTDKYKISREKLAFIVDATSAPIAGIAVISTWIGYEVGLFGDVGKSLGIASDGYSMFFDALVFRFYCILMLAFVLINAFSGEDYGPMKKAQKRALESGELSAKDAKPITSAFASKAEQHPKARINGLAALVPIVGLLTFLLGGIWVLGKGAETGSIVSFTAWKAAIGSADSILLLVYASGLGLGLAIVSALGLARLQLGYVLKAAWLGFVGSILPLTILVLAWSLKGSCDALLTGGFLAAILQGVISPALFPALLFLVAGLTAFATGTSWGTMAILIPTAIPVAFQLDGSAYGLVTMMSLGAVLDGAIFGDHCSPISDTTLMSSIASDCDHIHHVQTQLPYALTVGTLAIFFGYLPSAVGIPFWVGTLTAVALMVLFFTVLKGKGLKQQQNAKFATVS